MVKIDEFHGRLHVLTSHAFLSMIMLMMNGSAYQNSFIALLIFLGFILVSFTTKIANCENYSKF